MKCKRCGAEFHDNSGELCGKCKAQEISNIPTGVFLNQVSTSQFGPPTNIPLQALGGKELANNKLKDVLIGLGIVIALTSIVGLALFLVLRFLLWIPSPACLKKKKWLFNE